MRLHAQSHTQSGRLEELEVENTLQSGQQVFSGLQAVQRFRPSGGHGRIAVARGVEILQCVSGNGSEARPGSFAAKRIQTSADGGPASTLNRFHYADTRRQAELPAEERPVLLEQQAARTERLRIFNACLVDLFIRTRTQRPACVLLDIDATDDATHGQQVLSFFHGSLDQHQYFPLLVFDGETGFPLAAWLRPGKVHASCGAVSMLASIVARLRQAWPDVLNLVRGDNGFGGAGGRRIL